MAEIPGFVPRLLRDHDVALFRAEDRVFEAMLDGWRAQMLARGLTTGVILTRCAVITRFQKFAGDYPWHWRPVDLDDFMADRRSGGRPVKLSTLRTDSNTIAMFCAYVASPAYGWSELCERTAPCAACPDGLPNSKGDSAPRSTRLHGTPHPPGARPGGCPGTSLVPRSH